MKARIYTMIVSLMLMAGTSFGTSSELLLTNTDGSSIYVMFDGEIFDPGSAPLELYEVTPGRHSIDVYRFIKDSRGFYTRYSELVYRGNITIGARERMVTKLTSDGRLLIVSRIKLQPVPVHYGNTTGHGKPGGGNSGHNSHGKSGGNSGYNSHGQGGGSHNSGYNGHHGSTVPTPQEFSLLLRAISDASFEQTKLAIAKEALGARGVTADQVYQIMMRFSFEATKLEFAKWAYLRTIDRYNYFMVHRAFSFDSSKQELTRYISMQG